METYNQSNTADAIDEMELHGKTEETAPSLGDIEDAVSAEMNGIWKRLGHRNRIYDGVITNRGEEKLAWYVKSLDTAAAKAARELDWAEKKAQPYRNWTRRSSTADSVRARGGEEQRGAAEIDTRTGDEALDALSVAVGYFDECHAAIIHAELEFLSLTGTKWAPPAAFNNADAFTVVTAEQHAEITGIPTATTAARSRYKTKRGTDKNITV